MPYGRRRTTRRASTSRRKAGRTLYARRRSGGARSTSRRSTRRVSRARSSGGARTIRLVIQQAPAPVSADPVEALAAAKKVSAAKKRAEF